MTFGKVLMRSLPSGNLTFSHRATFRFVWHYASITVVSFVAFNLLIPLVEKENKFFVRLVNMVTDDRSNTQRLPLVGV